MGTPATAVGFSPPLHNRFSAYWLKSKCWVCCQHSYLWSWMRAFWCPLRRWPVQVLCVVTAQGGGPCWTILMVKIAVHSAEGCCTATTMALTSSKQKPCIIAHKPPLVSRATNRITPTAKANVLSPFWLLLEQSRESNSNAGKIKLDLLQSH